MKQAILDKAIKEAGKRLPFKTDKQMNEMLEYAAGSLAEAYRIGAEEAQGVIVERLSLLKAKEQER
jgi:hypothetical protein